MRLPATFIIFTTLVTGCATVSGSRRIVAGAVLGGASGAAGGAFLSPNEDSRGLNALVFGLAGALVGGTVAILSDPTPPPPSPPTLKERERAILPTARELGVPQSADLPDFVKKRLQPLVVEEFIETDLVTEEGTLHEPHKVYRIKRQPEFYSKPIENNSEGETK